MKKLFVLLVLVLSVVNVYAQDIEITKAEGLRNACNFISEVNTIANTQFGYCKGLQAVSGKDPSTFSYIEINKFAFANSLDLTLAIDNKYAGVVNTVIDGCVKAQNQINVLRSVLPVCR